jgi:hypothetical protein
MMPRPYEGEVSVFHISIEPDEKKVRRKEEGAGVSVQFRACRYRP